jgi:hypothetical protein
MVHTLTLKVLASQHIHRVYSPIEAKQLIATITCLQEPSELVL